MLGSDEGQNMVPFLAHYMLQKIQLLINQERAHFAANISFAMDEPPCNDDWGSATLYKTCEGGKDFHSS